MGFFFRHPPQAYSYKFTHGSMDLSSEPKSRLGEYGSAGSFAVCAFTVSANANKPSKATATKHRHAKPSGNKFDLENFLI
jgi:hypothetical protein